MHVTRQLITQGREHGCKYSIPHVPVTMGGAAHVLFCLIPTTPPRGIPIL